MPEQLLMVKDLHVDFNTRKGIKKAVDGVSFSVKKGEIFGIVGESGCGKSVTSMSILKLISSHGKISAGEIVFDGQNLLQMSEKDMQKKIRGQKVSMIFQDPMTSLNPLIPVGEQIAEILRVHKHLSKSEAEKAAIHQLELVGIPAAERNYSSYPHALSGGMKQRVMIAITMACEPELLIADEPTTALDVTIQAQIIELMKDVRNRTGTSIILITHDLGVVANTCDKVAVMYCGKIVEQGTTQMILNNPKHPYTKGLMASIPEIEKSEQYLYNINGTVPQIYENAKGCYFSNRCELCTEQCREISPDPVCCELGHTVSCHLFDGGRS